MFSCQPKCNFAQLEQHSDQAEQPFVQLTLALTWEWFPLEKGAIPVFDSYCFEIEVLSYICYCYDRRVKI